MRLSLTLICPITDDIHFDRLVKVVSDFLNVKFFFLCYKYFVGKYFEPMGHSIPHQTNGIFILPVSPLGHKILSHSLTWVIVDICLSLRTHIQSMNILYQLITSVSPALEIYLDSRPLLSTFIAVSSPFLLNYLNCSKLSSCFYPCFYAVYSKKQQNNPSKISYHDTPLLEIP